MSYSNPMHHGDGARAVRPLPRVRFVYWAHTNPSEPSRVFKRKRDAIAWAKGFFSGVFIVEPIATHKLPARLEYLRTELGYVVGQ